MLSEGILSCISMQDLTNHIEMEQLCMHAGGGGEEPSMVYRN